MYTDLKKKNIGLLLLRVGLGGAMAITHGFPKLQMIFSSSSSESVPFPNPLGIGAIPSLVLTVFAELVCSIFIVLGVKVRLSSFFLIITMAVAFFMVHAGDPFVKRELAFLYLIGFTVLSFSGSGRYTIVKEN